MSRLFEALKKAELGRSDEELSSPEAFLDIADRLRDLSEVSHEIANISLESRLAVWSSPQSLAADRFRLLRLQLQRLQTAGKLKTLLVTSPGAQDGKSTVILNLAVSLAHHKRSVLVLEADLRCPRLVARLGLKPWSGLSECVSNGSDPISSVRCIDPLGFYLLPAGQAAESPTELLQSDQFPALLKNLSPHFDWILIDSPPTGPIADTMVLRQHADGCLLVVRSGRTPRETVAEAFAQLGAGFVQGIVLNALEGMEAGYRKYYGYADK